MTLFRRHFPGDRRRPALALHCMMGSASYWGPIADRLGGAVDLRAFDKAQFQQTAFQFDRLALMVTMGAHLNDDAAIAASGLAQLDGVGQFYARTGEAVPRRLRVH